MRSGSRIRRYAAVMLSTVMLLPVALAGSGVATAQDDDQVLIATWAGPCCNGADWLTPWDGGGDAHWWNKIYGRLTTYEVKDQAYGDLIGDLAEAWTLSEDQLTWTFDLRDGVTWHDGQPFTAADVKFSFELCLDPTNSMAPCQYGAPLQAISGAKAVMDGSTRDLAGAVVVDDTTIAITFDAPSFFFPDTISELFILPKHALEGIAPADLKTSDYWETEQIGTGPFKWKQWNPGASVELERFDDYWRGAPKLAGIINQIFPDLGSALLAFEAGQIDFTYVEANEVARLREGNIGVIYEGSSGVDNYIECNSILVPACESRDFREALLVAIDRPGIVEGVFGGAAQTVPCLYGKPNLTGAVEAQAYDPERAKELLASSGVDVSTIGTLVFDTYYDTALAASVMTVIAENWKETLGLEVTLQPMDSAAWSPRNNAGEFQLSYGGAANGPLGDRAFNYFHSSAAYPAGGNGFEGFAYSNPDLDALLEQGRTELDPAKSDPIYQQACQIMRDDLPWLFLWQTVRYHVVSDKIENMVLIPAPGGGSYYDAAELWTKTS